MLQSYFLLLLPLATAAKDDGESLLSTRQNDQLTVTTNTGIITGIIGDAYPNVRQFRNIPYAQPPLGALRWAPPVPLNSSSEVVSGTTIFPPACPQFESSTISMWNTDLALYNIDLDGQSYTAGAPAVTSSEDCLRLAIWTPTDVDATDALPVVLFVPGGSFTIGGVIVPYQIPAPWVQRSQKHIVVTTNYRLNIMGFPWAAGLERQNVGLLDIRTALEWVSQNIAAFGGDPDRITLWGQSAGGIAADMLNYAFWDDPIAAGFFLQSGTANVHNGAHVGEPGDPLYSNFTWVAQQLGCDSADATIELECMRNQTIEAIQNTVGKYDEVHPLATLRFNPTADGDLVFANYTEQAVDLGMISDKPALISGTSNEAAAFFLSDEFPTLINIQTVDVFVCMVSNATDARARRNLTTYRYQYAGNFSNVTPLGWLGAYHCSDEPPLFGTYDLNGTATTFETTVSETMQDYLLAFISDPENGLQDLNWPAYEGTVAEGAGQMMRFAVGDIAATLEKAALVDDACFYGDVLLYNPAPTS